jgi:Chemotaxis signal transduction protein
MDIHIITFKCGNTEYGLDINKMDCIIKIPNITKLPNSPDYLAGIINLRGTIVPIIDFRMICSSSNTYEIHENCKIIVCNLNNKVGFIIDEINQILNKKDAKIQKPDVLRDLGFLDGILEHGDMLINIVNPDIMMQSLTELNSMESNNEIS